MKLIIAAAVGLLLTLLAAILHTGPAKRRVLALAQDYLAASQDIDLSAARLNYNLLFLTAELEQVALRSKSKQNATPFLEADSIFVNFSITRLPAGIVTIQEAVLQGLRLRYESSADGATNLPSVPESEPSGEGEGTDLGVLVESLSIPQASLSVRDEARESFVSLPDWTLQVQGDASTLRHDIDLRTGRQGSLALGDQSLPLTRLAFGGAWTSEGLEIRELALDAGRSSLQAKGSIRNFDNPQADLAAQLSVAAGEMGEFAGLPGDPEGLIDLTLNVTGDLETPRVTAQIQGEELGWRRVRQASLGAEANWDGGSEQLSLRSFRLQSPAGTVTGETDLSLGEQPGTSRAQLALENIDLGAVSAELEAPVRAASRLSATVDAEWTGLDWTSASGRIEAGLRPAAPEASANSLPIGGELLIAGTASDATLSIENLETAGTRWNGSVRLEDRTDLSGTLDAEIDTARTNREIAALLEKAGSWPETEGMARLRAGIGGTLEEPTVSLEVAAPEVAVGPVEGVSLSARARYSPESVVAEEVRVDWRDQTLRLRGSAGLETGRRNLEGAVEVRGGQIDAVLAGLGLDLPLAGRVQADAQIQGTLDEPEASVNLTAEDLEAYGEGFGRLQAEAAYRGGTLELRSGRLEQPEGGFLELSGAYDTEARSYQAEARAEELRFDSLRLPGDVPLQGTLSLSASGAAPVDDPQFTLRLNASGMAVAERLLGGMAMEGSVANQSGRLNVELADAGLSGSAEFDLQSPYPATFDLKLDELGLARLELKGPNGKALTGRLTASLSGSAPLAELVRGEFAATVDELRVQSGGLELRNEGPVRASLRDGTIQIDALTVAAGESTLRVAGGLPLSGSAASNALEIDGSLRIPDLLTFAETPAGLGVEGTLKLTGQIGGSVEELDPRLELRIAEGRVEHPELRTPVEGIEGSLVYKGGRVRLQSLTARLGEGRFDASGDLPLQPLLTDAPLALDADGGPAEFTAKLDGIAFDSLASAPEDLSGAAGLTIRGRVADPRDWRSLEAEAEFHELRAEVSGMKVEQAEPVRIALRGTTAEIESLRLAGPEVQISASGTAGFGEGGELNIETSASADAGVVTLFSEDLQATGPVQLEVTASGALDAPALSGFLEWKEGGIVLTPVQVVAEDLDLRLDLTPEEIRITRLRGVLNGGPMSGSGAVGYSGDGIGDMSVALAFARSFFNVPEGLQTQVWASLLARTQNDEIEVGGRVKILDGSYRQPIDIQELLFDYLQSSSVTLAEERSPFLERVRFNIAVETRNPLVVENDLVELAAETNLRVTGGFYSLGLTGQVNIEEGGQLYLNQKRYFIERGVVTFVNERRIQPELNILAKTRAGSYDISLQLSGGAEDYSATFTSDPPLSQPDIVSVLLTGRTLEQARGAELNIAKEQALSYLSGRAAASVSRQAERTLGITSVRIEPNLVARDSNPGARLTLGQDLTDFLRFVYSMNLTDSSDQIQILEYDVFRGFLARGTRQADNSARFDIEHGFRFGGPPVEADQTEALAEDAEIGEVRITGDLGLPESEVQDKLELRAGQEYDFFRIQSQVERLRRYYRKQGYPEAGVRVHRTTRGNIVDLEIAVSAGPPVDFVYEGMGVPGDLKKRVRRIWEEGFVDRQRLRQAEEAIRMHLAQENFWQGEVRSEVEMRDSRKRVLFEVTTGTRYRKAEIVFEGASETTAPILAEIVEQENRRARLLSRPDEVTSFLQEYLRQDGYLEAKVSGPQFEFDTSGRSARIILDVAEGPLFRAGTIRFEGEEAFEESRLREASGLSAETPCRLETLRESVSGIEKLYWANGYNSVRVDYSLRATKEGLAEVRYVIEEGPQDFVKEIAIEGTYNTSEKLARSQLEIEDGAPLDYRKTNQSRRNLYDLGAYSLVDIQKNRMGDSRAGGRTPVELRVKLRERKPFDIRYGLSYDSDRGPGFIADLINRNTLGSARVVGGRLRYDSDNREIRGFFSQPVLRRLPLYTNVSGFMRREISDTFITDRTGFSVNQELRLWTNNIFSYGYRFERTDTFDRDPDSIFQVPPFNVAPLTFSWTRETRDDYIDATSGSLMSSAFEFAPDTFGSDVQFIKYFGQYFKYFPLTEPAEIPFSNAIRPRVVYAFGVRAGLGKGLSGQDLVTTERFFSGGSTTLRGFEADSVGPTDFFGPTGGDAVFTLNNEIRFPLFKMFDGVGFMDMGNVYGRIDDFDPLDLRKSAGFGLRIRTPYVLIRVDYGFILDRKPDEPAGGFHFSIGQAF